MSADALPEALRDTSSEEQVVWEFTRCQVVVVGGAELWVKRSPRGGTAFPDIWAVLRTKREWWHPLWLVG